MRKCSNGVPHYLQHQVWKPEQDDPRGLGGDQINMALDSWNLLYGYLGDPTVKQNMVEITDYWPGARNRRLAAALGGLAISIQYGPALR